MDTIQEAYRGLGRLCEAILCDFWPFLGVFWPFLGVFGHFRGILASGEPGEGSGGPGGLRGSFIKSRGASGEHRKTSGNVGEAQGSVQGASGRLGMPKMPILCQIPEASRTLCEVPRIIPGVSLTVSERPGSSPTSSSTSWTLHEASQVWP